jgi:hypothetical protein
LGYHIHQTAGPPAFHQYKTFFREILLVLQAVWARNCLENGPTHNQGIMERLRESEHKYRLEWDMAMVLELLSHFCALILEDAKSKK